MRSETQAQDATTIRRYHGDFYPSATAQRTHLRGGGPHRQLPRRTHPSATAERTQPSATSSATWENPNHPIWLNMVNVIYQPLIAGENGWPRPRSRRTAPSMQTTQMLTHGTSQKTSAENNGRNRPLPRRWYPSATPGAQQLMRLPQQPIIVNSPRSHPPN